MPSYGKGIVITGAPASAKTEFIERLKSEYDLSDCLFFDELARMLLKNRPELRQDWQRLHREIYDQQSKRELESKGMYFISDRGTVDTFAFHSQTMREVKTSLECEYTRYFAVILLESSARLGESFYKNDEIRGESIHEALRIEDKLIKVWQNHCGYYLIKAKPDLEEKYSEFRQITLNCMKTLKGINNSN